MCPGGPTHTVSSGGAGVPRRSHSHCQSWGSQVCPGGPAHTVSPGGARCAWAVPLTPSVLGEPVCPGGPAHAVDSRFRPAGTATCSIWSTCSSMGPTWGPRTPRGTPPCTSAPSTTRSVSRDCAPRTRGCAERFAGGCPAPGAVMKPHRRGGLNSRHLFLTVLAACPRPRGRPAWFWGAAFLVGFPPLPAVSSSHVQRQKQPLAVSSAKDANPVRSGPHPHNLT